MDEAGGRITREEVEAVLQQARLFYQRELQSADSMRPDPASKKRRKRHAMEAWDSLTADGSCGNCTDLALVAIYVCLESESLGAKMKHLWFAPAGPQGRADHALVLVGDRMDLADNGYKVGTLATDDRCNGVWVIDAWLNIACRADEYPQRLWQQLHQCAVRGRGRAVGRVTELTGNTVPGKWDDNGRSTRVIARDLVNFGLRLLDSELSLHRAIDYDFQPLQGMTRRGGAVSESCLPSAQYRRH